MTLAEMHQGYAAMFTAREIDRVGQQYVDRDAAFYSVSGAGHEASAALAPFLSPHDWLHWQYRDKAARRTRPALRGVFSVALL